MKKNFFAFSRLEKILLLLFGVGIFLGLIAPTWVFVKEFSDTSPTKGGVYREGVVGQANDLVLNPVYVFGQREMSVESDIVNLLFRGLMSFNSKTGEIEDSMGEHFLSADKKTYTFRLKEGMRWHDGEPLTTDDIIFTFHDVIQHQDFSNPILKQAFRGVSITKISSQEVSFTISYPYKFFLTNFTVGILPKHILQDIPVKDLPYNEFSLYPVGNGPYFYDDIEEMRPNVFKMSLQAFRNSTLANPQLDTVEIWMYPSKESISLDSKKLNGVKPFAKYIEKDMFLNSHLQPKEFVLPQYSALFFNLNKKIFQGDQGKKIRLALQVGTDKEKLLEIVPAVRIDTPLLETKTNEWLYEYSLERANGSLKDAGYYYPSKKPKTIIPPKSDEKWITLPVKNPEYEFTGEKFLLAGIYPKDANTITIFNDEKEVLTHTRGLLGPRWKQYPAPKWEFDIKLGTHIQEGTQVLRVKFFDKKNKLIFQDALSVYVQAPVEQKEEIHEEIQADKESLEEIKIPESEIRETLDGNKITINLLTSSSPNYYEKVANTLKEDWLKFGVELHITVLPPQQFLDAVSHREYDILLFGENLGYNLDIYEFFHESQIGKDNLSDYNSTKASTLIQEIRSSHVPKVREKKLDELQEVLKNDIPAIFLFSPIYVYYADTNVKGAEIEKIAIMKDRFSGVENWYLKTEKTFQDNVSFVNYPEWISKQFISFITFSL